MLVVLLVEVPVELVDEFVEVLVALVADVLVVLVAVLLVEPLAVLLVVLIGELLVLDWVDVVLWLELPVVVPAVLVALAVLDEVVELSWDVEVVGVVDPAYRGGRGRTAPRRA